MAEIHFTEIHELLEEALDEVQELCLEERIARSLDVPEHLQGEAAEIASCLIDMVGDAGELALAYSDEVLYARVFDGERYLFPLPFMLSDSADATVACVSLAAYATRELIPLIITDVPRSELGFLQSVFPHIDAYTYEDDDDSFYVKVNNECDMLDSFPSLEYDGITLDEITECDKEAYAELCRDRSLNRYWGYDADIDNPDGDADFYLRVAEREFSDGVAIALAIREGGEFVGEATVYGFDYRASASIAVRVLPAFHSRGIGSRATAALIKLSEQMGLSTLRAEILNENVGSIKMTSKFMKLEKSDESKSYFTLKL